VIAGDIEGGGLLKRIGVFLTDYLIFEREDNDLVVDTDSMYGGLARERGHYLFDRGADVSHFRYFANSRTRRALQHWLTQEQPTELREFEPIQPAPQERKERAAVTGPRPAVIFLPGIMGSHLKVWRQGPGVVRFPRHRARRAGEDPLRPCPHQPGRPVRSLLRRPLRLPGSQPPGSPFRLRLAPSAVGRSGAAGGRSGAGARLRPRCRCG
jgi:hypothetical protein